MSFIASIIDSLFPARIRRATFDCPCGAVKCELNVPASSHALIEQTSALCHCTDCVGFCQACPNGEYLIDNYATHMVNFYKSDVKVVKGQDKIRGIKLSPTTVLIRLYCTDCGTPLGAELTLGPILLLYAKLITKGPIFMAPLVLGRKFAPPEARPYVGGVVMKYNIFGFKFFLRVFGRFLLGLLFQKNKGGMLMGPETYDGIPVGADNIKVKSGDVDAENTTSKF